MRKFYLILISLFFVISCSNNKKETHILDFKRFTIEVPKNWKKIKLKGIDSQVGGIISNDNDTMFFDLGMYSWDLKQIELLNNSIMIPKESENPFESIDSALLIQDSLRQIKKWDTISGYFSKIVSPRNPGDGVTGIYIDSLNSDKIRFNLYGIDLKPKNEEILLEAIQTIKFNMKD